MQNTINTNVICMSEFFNFEDTDRDFPFYKQNPKLSKMAWIVLLASIPIAFILYGVIGLGSEYIGSLVFCLTMLIPLLYYSNWDFYLIFRNPSRSEIKLALLLFIGYIIYAIAIDAILSAITQAGEINPEAMGVTAEMTVSLIYSMMGEELVKFIPLMFLMRLFYKYSNNRKLSIALSTIIVLISFGLLHYTPGSTPLISVILIQGFGSLFEVYGYLKTKNLFVPYLSHLLTDGVIFMAMLLGF